MDWRLRRLTALFVVVIVQASFGRSLPAQSPSPQLQVPAALGQFVPGLASRKSQWSDPPMARDPEKQADYRWEGGAVGALGLGTLALALAAGLCNSDSGTKSCTGNVLGSFLVGSLVGGVSGLFIGSSIPKSKSDSTADTHGE